MGGFNNQGHKSIRSDIFINLLSIIFVGVVPLFFILSFILVGQNIDKNKRKKIPSDDFMPIDAFTVPHEEMQGFKLAYITGASPTLTGLTGDIYKSDDSAHCDINPEHVPPVVNCECGFYAYSEKSEADFEMTIYPGSFVLHVDLFGLGFRYKRGYRAESQVVRRLFTPKRCQHCHILPGRVFVKTYRLANDSYWWKWEYRCSACSFSFDSQDKLEKEELESILKTKVSE